MEGPQPHGRGPCEKCGEVHDPLRCQGHNRRGKQCTKFPMKGGAGGDKCQSHGAKTPIGAASPHWKNGKRSRLFGGATAQLAPAFALAMRDPELESLKTEIATLEARLQQLLGRLIGTASAENWVRAHKLFELSLNAPVPADRAAALAACRKLLRDGAADQDVWAEVYAVQEQRRKLAETQGRNSQRLRETMSAEHAMSLLAATVAVINEHVTDRETLQKISVGLRLIATGGVGVRPRDAAGELEDA